MDDNLNSLNEKLKAYRAGDNAEKSSEQSEERQAQNTNAGIRAGAELVVSIGAGTLIGYGLDNWLGTKPWFLIVFILAGIFAGFMNIYRITQNMDSSVGYAALRNKEKTGKNAPED